MDDDEKKGEFIVDDTSIEFIVDDTSIEFVVDSKCVEWNVDGVNLSEMRRGEWQAPEDRREDHRMDALRYKTGGISELELTVIYDTDPFPELSVLGMVGVNLNLWSRLKVAWRILRGKSRFIFWEVDDGH